MTRVFAFFALVLAFFVFEGGFFLQNFLFSSHDFLFLSPSAKPQIIFGGGYLFSDVLYLNRGNENNVQSGDLVLYDSKILIGKIDEVFLSHSKVIPFFKFGEKNAFRAGPQKSILFEGLGNGAGEIRADFPSSIKISAGDGVYLAENPNYLVGIVENSEKKEGRDFQKVYIRIPISLKSITDVDIIKNNAKKQ